MKGIIGNKRGITLIALIVTIIVLLILAGVTIATLTGENGILTKANTAKIETAIGSVKEGLKLEQGEERIEGTDVTPETLLAEGKVNRTVQQGEDGNYYMYYAIEDGAYNGMQGLGKGNLANLKDVFLLDDNLNVKYIASNGEEYGDNIEEKILNDETEIRFSSKAFSEYISKISGVTEYEMKFKWMKELTSLTITDPAVDSLEDLVFFPNLESLTLGEYGSNIPQVTSMDGVENCTKLTSLTIIYGPDKDYSAVGKLFNLRTFVRYSGSDYENIIDSLKNCKNLENFTLRVQGITDMYKVSELGNLKGLNLSNNQISKIEGLENMTNLETLNLSYNQIEDITPLSENSSLISLNLLSNKNIDGDRNNYTGERLIALNKIGEILDRGGTIDLDIDKLRLFTNYKSLNLSSQNLTTLEALDGLTQLEKLNLYNNKITLEDKKSQEILKSMSNLVELNLSSNSIKDITIVNELKNLRNLDIGGNTINLKQIEDIISSLNSLRVSTEILKTIVNCDVEKITKLNISASQLTELPDLSKFTNLKELNLNNNSDISNFDIISKISSLEVLYLSSNNLHEIMIDFSKLANLRNLSLSYNTLWSEDLENLKVLRNNSNLIIDLSANSIIDASALLELKSNTIINLQQNVNLSQSSKDRLTEKFKNYVRF